MFKKSLLILSACAPLVLSGCVISVGGDSDDFHQMDYEQREKNNRKHISRLETNMQLEVITNRLGLADFDELYQRDGSTYRVLYYRTQRMVGDGVTTKDECTPLVFENGQLVGWGDSAIKQYL